MANPEFNIDDYGFGDLAPAGFYLAIRVGFAFPEFEHNALPLGWVHMYTRGGLIMHDPVMRWIYGNEGVIRWSEIDLSDSLGVLAQAEEFGLNYGASVCISGEWTNGLRSFGSFCRCDREFSASELDELSARFRRLHDDQSPPDNITDAEIEALRLVREGLLIKEAAFELGISEGAVKQRLRGVKAKLKARTNTQAVARASQLGLI